MSNNITAIIVTYNSAKTISDCLKSIIKYSVGIKIVVVDNNSQDSTRQIIKQQSGDIVLIESDDNLGFSKANNLGFKSVNTEYVVFINPDTKILEKDSLEKLKEVLNIYPSCGLVGPKFIYPDGSIQRTVRNLPTLMRVFKEYILGIKGEYDFYQPKQNNFCEVESVVGACMVCKSSVFKKVGGFDERFFLYYEDLQLCKNIRRFGLKIGYFPQVSVEHIVGASGEGKKTSDLLVQSAKKYHGQLEFSLIQMVIKFSRILS